MHIGSLSPFTVYKIKQEKLWGGRKVSRKLENSDFLFIRRYWGRGGWRCDPSQQGGEEIVMVMWDRDDLFLHGWVSVEEKMWMWWLLFCFIHFAPQQVSAIIYPCITINEVQTPKKSFAKFATQQSNKWGGTFSKLLTCRPLHDKIVDLQFPGLLSLLQRILITTTDNAKWTLFSVVFTKVSFICKQY